MQYSKIISLDIQQYKNELITYDSLLNNFQIKVYNKIAMCNNPDCIKRLAIYYEELINLKRHLQQVRKHKKQLAKWHCKIEKDKSYFFLLKKNYESDFEKN